MDLDGAPDLIQVAGAAITAAGGLRTTSGQRLAYATSWWEASHVDEYLQNRALPIWASLTRLRTELYRDVRIHYGNSAAFRVSLEQPGPFGADTICFGIMDSP